MTYVFACHECRVKVEIERPVEERNDPVTCRCGKAMERFYTPFSICVARESHHDFSDEEWAAKLEVREANEWLNAYGAADGEKVNVKGSQMTLDGIADKSKRIASGEKPPEELTWDKIMPHERHLYQTYDQYIDSVATQATAQAS